MNKKTSLITILALCLMLVSVIPAYAENSSSYKISTLETSIMPEYDTSDVLVLNAITFNNNTDQPYSGEIKFPVPKGTSSNIVTETTNSTDNHVTVKVEDKGDYAEFVWKPSQPIQAKGTYQVHLEYYYNSLPGTGAKTFAYQFNATVPVDQHKIYAYQPLKATDFKMEPVGQSLGTDQKGFQIYGLNSSNLKIGDKVDMKISYTKNDPSPSVDPPSAAGGTAAPAGQNSESPLNNAAVLVPLLAIIVGIAVIVAKAYNSRQKSVGTSIVRQKQGGNRRQAPANSKFLEEKRRIRQMLLDGEIGEDTYHEILEELEKEYQ